MSGQYIIVSSITYAYKGKNILEKKGISADVERAPSEVSKCGCQYAIKVKRGFLDKAVKILEDSHIRIISTWGE